MYMPKKHQLTIYRRVFKDGVMVVENKNTFASHPELRTIPNLHVLKTMKSLKSKGWVTEKYAWRHFYFTLTDIGIEKLRAYLHLPADLFPDSLIKSKEVEKKDAQIRAERQARMEARGDKFSRGGPKGPRGAKGPRAPAGGAAPAPAAAASS